MRRKLIVFSQRFRERRSIGTASIPSPGFMALLLVISTAARAPGQAAASDDERRPDPRLVTADTRADPQAIAALEKPDKAIFHDDFESPDSVKKYFEPWRGWRRYPSPGYMFLYTYWMDMRRDRDGNYWGNMLGPAEGDRIVIDRDRWYCLEHMIRTNPQWSPGWTTSLRPSR